MSAAGHPRTVDDRRIGLLLRALRRRLGKRQVDLARAAGSSQSAVSRAERGHLDTLSIRRLRALFGAVDARFEGSVRWRGGDADYLLDRAHADLGASVADRLVGLGWTVLPEVTFVRGGERGSIDLLGVRPDARAAVLVELKSEMTSFEQQQRRLDGKSRVLPSVVEERFGWRPRSVAVILVLADNSTNRGRVRHVQSLIRGVLPASNWQLRRWLAQPIGHIAGIWFLRDMRRGTGKCRPPTSHRVRVGRGRRG